MDLPDLSSMTSTQREDLVKKVKMEMATAQAQELIQKLSEKCIKKCIPKPGTSLDSSEKKCMTYCVDRYIDVYNIAARSYQTRLQQEGTGMNQAF